MLCVLTVEGDDSQEDMVTRLWGDGLLRVLGRAGIEPRNDLVEPTRGWARSWPRAALVAVVAVVLLGLAFAVVPDRLALLVERRGGGAVLRDAVLTVWFVVAVAGTAWALVWLQRRGIL